MSSKATKIVGGIVVLAAIGYGAYYYANQTANDVMIQKVNAYLVENKLQDKITWEKSEASVAGSGTFYNVIVKDENTESVIKLQKLHITKLEQSEDGGAAEFSFEGASDANGKSIFLKDFASAGGMDDSGLEDLGYDASLPLLNGEVKSNYSKKANDSSLFLKLNQEQVGDVSFDVKAIETNAFIDKALELKKLPEDQVDPSLLMGPLTTMKLSKLEVSFDDKGVLAKAKAAGGAQEIKAEECQFGLAMMGVSDQAEEFCKSVIAFADGSKKTIVLKVNPAQPYPVINFMTLGQSGMPDFNKLVKDLNLTITN